MTRVATPKNEDVLLNVAHHGTAAHVETHARLYRQVKRNQALEQGELQHARRRLGLYQDHDGSWVIHGRLTAEQGALLSRALDAAEQQLFQEQEQVPEEVAAEIDQNLPID